MSRASLSSAKSPAGCGSGRRSGSPTETTAEKAISRATLSVSAAVIAFARLARNSSDISKDNLLEPDRQFEYLLLRRAFVAVTQRLFLSMREPANLRYNLKNFGRGILQCARGAFFSEVMRANSARILWW